MKMQKCFLLVSLLTIVFLLLAHEAQAVLTLSVSPRRGGQNIRFEESQPGVLVRNEEATVSVTSTEAAPYTISLTVYQPLTNQFGNMIPQEAFVIYSPSTPLGSLTRLQTETPVMMGQVPIFTSNSGGDDDNFILVFAVRIPENQAAGIYHTQMTFTADLASHRAGVLPSVVNLDVELEIRSTFRMNIVSSKGGQRLDLGRISKDRAEAAETLNVQIESNIGTPYNLIQQMTEPLTSQEGVAVGEGGFTFLAAGGENGSLKTGGSPTVISQSPAPVYSSGSFGQGDQLQLQYILRPDPAQRAGIYDGNITFKVDSSSPFVSSQVVNIPVRMEIETIFDLGIEIPEGGSSLHFGTFRSGEEKQEKKVLITIRSNIGQPYQVSQIVSRKLTNAEGSSIPVENFIYHGSNAESGSLLATAPTPVREGETPVYTSDSNGSPDAFILDYSLTLSPETRAGSYTSDVRYSISTL